MEYIFATSLIFESLYFVPIAELYKNNDTQVPRYLYVHSKGLLNVRPSNVFSVQ